MPGQDLLIGNDGDYVDDGEGFFETTLTAQPSLRHQILDILGDWVGDPDAGSEQRGIAGRLNSQREADLRAEAVRRAMAPLIAEGMITDLKITVDRDEINRFAILVRCRDTQSGGVLTLDTRQSFGV